MRKPIFITKIPSGTPQSEMELIAKLLEDKLGNDYYTIVVATTVDGVEFQQFDERNIEPADLEKLREELGLIGKEK